MENAKELILGYQACSYAGFCSNADKEGLKKIVVNGFFVFQWSSFALKPYEGRYGSALWSLVSLFGRLQGASDKEKEVNTDHNPLPFSLDNLKDATVNKYGNADRWYVKVDEKIYDVSHTHQTVLGNKEIDSELQEKIKKHALDKIAEWLDDSLSLTKKLTLKWLMDPKKVENPDIRKAVAANWLGVEVSKDLPPLFSKVEYFSAKMRSWNLRNSVDDIRMNFFTHCYTVDEVIGVIRHNGDTDEVTLRKGIEMGLFKLKEAK